MKAATVSTIVSIMLMGISLILFPHSVINAQTGKHDRTLEPSIPQLINYHGKLLAKGQPVSTGVYTLSFSIYDKPVGKQCNPNENERTHCARRIWGPQVFDGKSGMVGHGAQVPVTNGFFSVILGPRDVEGESIMQAFTSSKRFVEVTVQGDKPILPRQQVLSAPFALTSFGNLPVGGIAMFSGNPLHLPENWRLCDGQMVVDVDSPYHGKNVPDLRGLFVRGALDSDVVTTTKGSNTASHTHRVAIYGTSKASKKISSYYSEPYVIPDSDSETGFWLAGAGDYRVSRHFKSLEVRGSDHESHEHSVSMRSTGTTISAGTSTVPRHMVLNYIIRIK